MEAGYALDVLIAERVTGWATVEGIEGGGLYRQENMPHYSTEIGDAWRVVEELRDRGYFIRIEPNYGVGWWVRLQGQGEDDIMLDAFAQDIALAICLAALKALTA